jgi:hypothetical protein
MLAVGLCAGLLVGVGMMIGTLVAVNRPVSSTPPLPETLLHASASHSGKSFAMATGFIDTDIEGVFLLDYLTGDIHCFVLSTRIGKWVGTFKHNVIPDLGVQQGKEPNYVMVTGQAAFQRGAATTSPAGCAVYVADANTGQFVAYTIMWNRTMGRANAPQTGGFTLLDGGKARTLEIRD